MSKVAAEVFGLTQSELETFLDINAVNIIPNEPIVPPSDASYSILIFSLLILLVALVAFVVSALFWYQNSKNQQAFKSNQEDDPTPKKRDGLADVSNAPLDDRLSALEPAPFDEKELNKMVAKDVDVVLTYFKHKERLQVHLRNVSLDQFSDAVAQNTFLYVVTVVEPEKDAFFESDLKPVADRIVFDEKAEFDLLDNEIEVRNLRASVFACDRFSRNRLVTENTYQMALQQTESDGEEESDVVSVVVTGISSRSGSPQPSNGSEKYGEVLCSLCYMPTSGRLSVVIQKGRRLQYENRTPVAVYVRVSLMVGGQTAKTVQSTVVRNSMHPVFNEAFNFRAALERITETDLVITTMVRPYETNTAITLGQSFIGPDAKSIVGRKHFEAMLMSPRKTVSQWHYIKSLCV